MPTRERICKKDRQAITRANLYAKRLKQKEKLQLGYRKWRSQNLEADDTLSKCLREL
jgi:hypothetical protein